LHKAKQKRQWFGFFEFRLLQAVIAFERTRELNKTPTAFYKYSSRGLSCKELYSGSILLDD
jgi:hypothetical protein